MATERTFTYSIVEIVPKYKKKEERQQIQAAETKHNLTVTNRFPDKFQKHLGYPNI